jgi:hypothetical protein
MNIPAFYRYLNIFKWYIYKLVNIRYYSITDLVGYRGTSGEKIHVDSFYDYGIQSSSQREGITYTYSTTQAKSGHNGVTVISDTVPYDGTQPNLAAFLAGNGETDPSGTGAWVMHFQGYLTPAMAGAVGGGSVDDTAAVLACKTALASRAYGGVIRLEDYYLMSQTLEISSASIYVAGLGWNTGLVRTGDYGDTVHFHGDNATGAYLSGCGLLNLQLKATAKTTNGAHIHCNGIIWGHFDRVYTQDGFIGWQMDGVTQTYISNIFTIVNNLYGESYLGRRYMQFGNATGSYSHPSGGGVWMDNLQMRSFITGDYVEYGLNILSGDGYWFNNGHVGNASGACINMSATTSEIFNLVYFDNFMTDATRGVGLNFEGNVVPMVDVKFSNCTFKGGGIGQYGITTTTDALAYSVLFSNCSVSEYLNTGISIRSPDFRHVYINDTNVYGNSLSGSGLFPGINLAANTRNIYINNGRSGGHNSSASGTSYQSYGIQCSTGHSDVVINGTNLKGNVTSSFLSGAGNGVTFINVRTSATESYSSGTPVIEGRLGIGATAPTVSNLLLTQDITGNATSYGIIQRGKAQTDVTTCVGIYSANSTANSANVTNYYSFFAQQEALGSGSTITNQYGYFVSNAMTGATNNYGIGLTLAAGSGRWNVYASGTARNWFNGGVEVAVGAPNMTAGFTHIPAAGGAPSGVPTNPEGNVPLYYDTTNDKLYVYTGSAWKGVALS